MKAIEIRAVFVACVNALATRVAKGAENSRIKGMRKEGSFFNLDDKACAYLAQTHVNPDALANIFPASGAINPTVPYRFAQFVNGLHAASYKNIDGTTARALIALRIAGGTLNRDALNNLLTGRVKVEGIAPNTRGVGVRQLDSYIGRIGRGTVETQLSRSFGANGFARALGMVTTVGASNFSATLQPDNLFCKRFFALVDNATVGQLEEMFGGESEE